MPRPQELHILVGCADARDYSVPYMQSVYSVIEKFKNYQNTDVQFKKIRTPGAFVTIDLVNDIKRLIDLHQRQYSKFSSRPANYYVHLQSHGELEPSEHEHLTNPHHAVVAAGSPLNCGMLGATALAVEMESVLLEYQPHLKLAKGDTLHIQDESDIRTLLRRAYAYDGYLAGDWIRSIDDLRTHSRHQRTILQRAINSDADLKSLNIHITAGLLDYRKHALVRLDGGLPASSFWDQVHAEMRERVGVTGENDDMGKQSSKQSPLAGVVSVLPHNSAEELHSRILVKAYYQKTKKQESDQSLSNALFKLQGSSFELPDIPFGPYMIAGYFYGIRHLGLKDQLLVAETQEEIKRLQLKIQRDPLMNFFTRAFDVNLIPVSLLELEKEFPELMPTEKAEPKKKVAAKA